MAASPEWPDARRARVFTASMTASNPGSVFDHQEEAESGSRDRQNPPDFPNMPKFSREAAPTNVMAERHTLNLSSEKISEPNSNKGQMPLCRSSQPKTIPDAKAWHKGAELGDLSGGEDLRNPPEIDPKSDILLPKIEIFPASGVFKMEFLIPKIEIFPEHQTTAVLGTNVCRSFAQSCSGQRHQQSRSRRAIWGNSRLTKKQACQ
jgi:hypothetical protein